MPDTQRFVRKVAAWGAAMGFWGSVMFVVNHGRLDLSILTLGLTLLLVGLELYNEGKLRAEHLNLKCA